MTTGDKRDGPGPPPSPGRRLGLLGGTFDPPHNGHLAAAAAARHALGLDEVALVVANRPWQKVGARPVSPAADRWVLTEAAVDGLDGIGASRLEIDRGGDSYSADTLAELRRADPSAELFLVVGADAARGLPTWVRPEEVRTGATIVLIDRPGIAGVEPPSGWTFVRVTMPRLDVSSTDLRRRVAEGEPLAGLTPAAVCAAIARLGLYREPLV